MATYLRVIVALWLGFFSAEAGAQDNGIPDTARTLTPSIVITDCQPTIKIRLPVYLFTDAPHYTGWFRFSWTGSATCDSVSPKGVWATHADYIDAEIDNAQKEVFFVVATDLFSPQIPPCQETIAIIHLNTVFGDAVNLNFPMSNFQLQPFGLGPYMVSIQSLNRSISVPDTIAMVPGNADCSNQVSIADVVFLINYIFSGGMPPYDRNAADPDATCAISIADAVYIINYIFAGGNAPQPGCVVP